MKQEKLTDYIVVGAGTAGSVVTRRLLDAGYDVTVIEAGPEDSRKEISGPFDGMALFGSEVDWGFMTVPQKHANDRAFYQPRGKALGGSTILNGMVYIRGAAADYDAWAANGAADWSWADVEPYFRKIESFDGPADGLRGNDGPVHVHANKNPDPLVKDFVAAAVQAGHPLNPDYNSGESTGASFIQATVAGGKRVTAWRAYVEPVKASPRLHVITETVVNRILLEDGRAAGVEFVHDGNTRQVHARREVILTAGTFGSPQLLMLSGIGPAEHLKEHSIDVVLDLPGVGQNLRDHVASPVVWEAATEVPVPRMTGIEAQVISAGGEDAQVRPDWQSVFLSFPLSTIPDGLPTRGFTGLAILLHPHSSGSVRLRSADPRDVLEIDPGILSDERDLEALVDHVESVRTIGTQSALAPWVKAEAQPGAGTTSREQMRDFVRASVDSSHHQVGTARIGTDELAVVDSQLRVRGIAGLRVADASVMPLPPAGNTAAAAMMIGERAAAFVLGEA